MGLCEKSPIMCLADCYTSISPVHPVFSGLLWPGTILWKLIETDSGPQTLWTRATIVNGPGTEKRSEARKTRRTFSNNHLLSFYHLTLFVMHKIIYDRNNEQSKRCWCEYAEDERPGKTWKNRIKCDYPGSKHGGAGCQQNGAESHCTCEYHCVFQAAFFFFQRSLDEID